MPGIDQGSEAVIREVLSELWSPVLAVTTVCDGTPNGLIASTGLPASVVWASPRILVEIGKYNLTHDLMKQSGVFAVHLLPAEPPEAMDVSLGIVRRLGMHSGRQGDKFSGIPWRAGITGCPILRDAQGYVEARVVEWFDADELSVVVGDVVSGGRLSQAPPLTFASFREHLPADWVPDWRSAVDWMASEARKLRGLS